MRNAIRVTPPLGQRCSFTISALVATERGRPAFVGQSRSRWSYSGNGSYRCMQARCPRPQEAPVRRAGETPAPPGGGSAACGRDARAPRRWQCGVRARRPRPQEAAGRRAGETPASPGGSRAACGRDARAPRRRRCCVRARRPRPPEVAVRRAGATPVPPGGAGTRTVSARQEHSRTTMGRPGRNASY